MDFIVDALLWVVKGSFKLLWWGIKSLFGFSSGSSEHKKRNKNSATAPDKQMGGLFDHRIPTNWTATYNYHGEHIRVTLHHHKTQPSELEFINEMRKMRGGRINVAEAKLINIVQG